MDAFVPVYAKQPTDNEGEGVAEVFLQVAEVGEHARNC